MLQKDGAGRSQKALDDLVQRRSSLQSTYENTLERLGATQEQNPGYRAKVAFGDSLGHLAKAMQEYYADGNNALVDGLFTAAEIKLLVTPTSLRPAQYRPDLPMLVEQWRANFWNPEWEGMKLPREMHRFLLATFKKASEEFAVGKIAEMDGGEVEAGDVEMAVAEGAWMPRPVPPLARRVRILPCQRQRPRHRLGMRERTRILADGCHECDGGRKALWNRGPERKSGKWPALVVGKNSNGKSQGKC
jgi:hypothetical protein